jgi:undecaprenyl-diphosphatase
MATAIYLCNKKWGIWFVIAAILMNISRIVAGVHYPSDILGGAVVGIMVGYLVVYSAKKWKPKEIGKPL